VVNIVAHASDNVSDNVQLRVIAYFASIDSDLGSCVANGLGRDTTSPAYAEALKLVESRANRA
jgi:catalase